MAAGARGTRRSGELGAFVVIGVIANAEDHGVVRAFFELFKTPWEFLREDGIYDVVLCAGDFQPSKTAKLIIVYAGRKTKHDVQAQTAIPDRRLASRRLVYGVDNFPIYGSVISFAGGQGCLLKDNDSGQCVGYFQETGNTAYVRIGYDLFHEIRTLLTVGQPSANAIVPTLDLHIAVLRDLIISRGISLVEIPPVPEGYNFIACLTHDVDHPSIRQHKLDHTMLGFIYRATLGSLRNLIAGQITIRQFLRNWVAALKLPLVHLGFAKDFWREFAERYQNIEQEFRSTFFVLPFKNRPGVSANGPAPAYRASGYAARDIADVLARLIASGNEVGLHGIDAWADISKGREELREIATSAGAAPSGVRMHWLYYNQDTPAKLEKAGAAYDSTFGYNDAIGYRAGTTQVYKPLAAHQLLELPLHVMDTALFYPSRMELSPREAEPILEKIQNNAARFGGVVTVNWHDRSLAPERLWDEPYRSLLASMKRRGAWFATAGEAVAWFRKRRSAAFETDPAIPGASRVALPAGESASLPGLRLRTHRPAPKLPAQGHPSAAFSDEQVASSFPACSLSGAN